MLGGLPALKITRPDFEHAHEILGGGTTGVDNAGFGAASVGATGVNAAEPNPAGAASVGAGFGDDP